MFNFLSIAPWNRILKMSEGESEKNFPRQHNTSYARSRILDLSPTGMLRIQALSCCAVLIF